MVRVFVAPLGFHEDIVLRFLTAHGAGRGDLVYVVTCGPVVGAVKRAYDSLVALCSKQRFPHPILVELDCRDFYESVRRLKSVFKTHASDEVALCVGGGLRALTIVSLLSLITLEKPFTLHYEPESDVEGFVVEKEFFLNVFRKLSEAERRALEIIVSNPGIRVEDLSNLMSVKEKTARNIVTRLKKRKLVIKRGRLEGVEPTKIALALLA